MTNPRFVGAPLEDVIADGRRREIPGVGVALEETIRHFHEHGTTPRSTPCGPRCRPGCWNAGRSGTASARLFDLVRKLGIASLDDLEAAGRQNKLAQAKGFGSAVQAKVLAGIELLRRSHLHPELSRIVASGDLRRGTELISSLALVAETDPG